MRAFDSSFPFLPPSDPVVVNFRRSHDLLKIISGHMGDCDNEKLESDIGASKNPSMYGNAVN